MPVLNYTPQYRNESPYRVTPVHGNFMGYYIHRSVVPQGDDTLHTLSDQRHVGRPDLLAFDFYQDPNLWWVFAVRNGLEDPVHDLTLNMELFIPPLGYLRTIL